MLYMGSAMKYHRARFRNPHHTNATTKKRQSPPQNTTPSNTAVSRFDDGEFFSRLAPLHGTLC